MADTTAGVDFSRGDVPPATPIKAPPVFVWPPQPVGLFKFLFGMPGYFLPLNILYMGLAVLTWFALTPDLSRMTTFQWDWIAIVYGRNLALTFLVYGGLHLRFYIRKAQGTRYMLNRREPRAKQRHFLFSDQVRETMFWTAVSGVGIWSAYEVVTLWAFATGGRFAAAAVIVLLAVAVPPLPSETVSVAVKVPAFV